jgi:capsular exopolysaccharide synthesis family protein
VVEALLLRRQEVEIAQASTLPTAEVIDPAVAPRFRHFPRTLVSLGLAAVLGLLLGCALALLQERVHGSLASEAELEELTGLPCFGTVPDHARGKERSRRAAAGFVAMRDAPQGPEAEAYRALRTNLRFALDGGREPRTFAVTSCMPGEGKSTTNINLAYAYAGAGARVLLVDCDLRRNSVDRYLRIPAGPGLAEALGGDPWGPALRLVAENLWVLPAGDARGAGVKRLAGPAIEGLIEQFAAEFDVVVLDVPPALSVADLEGFAHRLDAVMLLYRSEGHPSSAVETAVRRLRQSGAPLVGCLLNGVRPLKHAGYYHYGYGDEEGGTQAA